MLVDDALLLLALVSCIFWVIACWCVWDFMREGDQQSHDFTPPVSVLKPVSGLDAQATTNFRSFCEQDYPQYEVLFATQDSDDAALPVLERLQREKPRANIRLLTAPPLGTNAKVSNLHALAMSAQNEILVISDSDMVVSPRYLRQVVAPLWDESVGVVTCLYQGVKASSWASRFEAFYVATTYMPMALVAARLLHFPVAFGSTIALRKKDLERIGGFAAIADHLADDYQIAARVAALGKRVVFARYIVRNVLGAESWQAVWNREVRWIRCVRASRPLEYPGLLLSFALPLAIAAAAARGFDTGGRNIILVALVVRWITAWLVTGYTGHVLIRRMLPLLPLRDLMTFAVWCAGVIGYDVEWRGQRFRVQADGRFQPVSPGSRRQESVYGRNK